ncbi:hypothetical protein GCM10007063_33830 [Lentibacillus kapialis]|uniref:Uncharacterized protein n=1 Tax=Lentibacillus kapialis TaxID=340214 RepID=A0A917V1A1_9BACI|nr:hypothetical protein [Lentibacillus kapialis]GGK08663.1 hypothetical protein GCM10007063_33830 [Lentibacillus kapialis]
MRYDDPLVEKEAKKHKKFFETFTINPGSYRINNHHYFFVNYYKWKKMTDCAVVSPTSRAERSEYMEAFDALMEHAQLTTLILKHGGERSSANMDAFTTMKKFLSDVLNEGGNHLTQESKDIFNFCLERIQVILNLQERIINIYDDFQQKNQKYHDGDEENITRQDMEKKAKYLGEIDYIQYRQVVAIYEYIPKFKYIKELNDPEVKKHMTTAVKRYLTEFSKGEEEQLENIERVKFQPNMEELTREEHIEGAKKDFYKNLEETKALSRKELRYPG